MSSRPERAPHVKLSASRSHGQRNDVGAWMLCESNMIYNIEWMKLLKEAKVEELDSYRMRDGGMLVLQDYDGFKWVVAYYDRSDIEQWMQEFDSLNTARAQFEYRKRTDKGQKGPVEKTGAKR